MTRQTDATPIRVLLVEDSEHDRIAFERALHKSDLAFELSHCERAEEIPAALQPAAGAYDLVVVDQKLSGMDGLTAFRMLTDRSDLPPFVMLTGAGSESLAVEAIKAGIYDYIVKDPRLGYLELLPLKLKDVKQRHFEHRERLEAKAELKKLNAELEARVAARTEELKATVNALEQEIVERRLTESRLRQSEAALQELSRKIIETQENERRFMAKELHDSIGASLAAIKFALEDKLHYMQGEPPKDIISLEKIVAHISDTIREVRRISTSLRPAMLDDLGLLNTIDWYCSSSQEFYGQVRIHKHIDIGEAQIPDLAKIVIYRVLQEALSNALKHSTADEVRIDLVGRNGNITLRVKDNGCGFDPEGALQNRDPLSGYGLTGMHDRAQVIGATLVIDSRPGLGTDLCLTLAAARPADS